MRLMNCRWRAWFNAREAAGRKKRWWKRTRKIRSSKRSCVVATPGRVELELKRWKQETDSAQPHVIFVIWRQISPSCPKLRKGLARPGMKTRGTIGQSAKGPIVDLCRNDLSLSYGAALICDAQLRNARSRVPTHHARPVSMSWISHRAAGWYYGAEKHACRCEKKGRIGRHSQALLQYP